MNRISYRFRFLYIWVAFALSISWTMGHHKPRLEEMMSRNITALVGSLRADQKQQACVDFSDEIRFNWNYTPRERKGLTLKSMTEDQRKMAMELVRSVLSDEGYSKMEQIIDLENVLRVIEKRTTQDTYRDPENYAFLFYGLPGKQPWAWRLEGHHLFIHFTVVNGKVAFTPGFMGSNPAKVLAEVPQKGKRILAQEQDIAFDLLNSLSPDQQSKAVLGAKAPNEIVSTNQRKVRLDKMEGIAMKDLSSQQKVTFEKLIQIYLNRYHVTLKKQQWETLVRSGLDQIHFAWIGDKVAQIGEGHGHYYRIHGPTFLIEFDNTQNGGNHIHSVVRDLTNDFGEDLLKDHYEKAHRK